MKQLILAFIIFSFSSDIWAQATFKAGWDTYKIGVLTHEYNYSFSTNDSIRLSLTDSSKIMSSPDSAVVLTMTYPARESNVYKTINYFNPKKQVLKTEEYRGDNLLVSREWKYDDKNRKNYYTEDNKVTGKNYRKNYDYATDKKTGDLIVTESSYYNGKIEFYTKTYYDKKMVKYKEVRLNDNNKDIIHIESYTYGDNGQITERSVYFPEFKVTKKFPETPSDDGPKCAKTMTLNATEKIYLPGKAIYLKNFLNKIRPMLTDPECARYQYKYVNFVNEIIVSTTKTKYLSQVALRYKEKMP